MKKDFIEYFVEGVIIIAIIILVVGIIFQIKDNQKNPSQSGYCPYCERKYEFVQYAVHSDATYCIYECPSCGRAVEIPLYKKERMEK